MDRNILLYINKYIYAAEAEHERAKVRPTLVRLHPETIRNFLRSDAAKADLSWGGSYSPQIIRGIPIIEDTTVPVHGFRLCYEVDYNP